MSNLLQFFLRFGGHFMFFLLEGICFFIIIRYNDYQNRVFFSSSNTIIGFAAKKVDDAVGYVHLNRDIKALKKENAALRSQLDASFYLDKAERDTSETADRLPRYSFISATITNRAIIGNNNNVVIDRGSKHGVKMHMGVISEKGVVGIVTGVSTHYAKVMTILHRQAAISASIRRNGVFGSLVWKGTDYRQLNLEAIPKHVKIQIGDTIQTSGYSDIFPAGIMIGTIGSFNLKDGNNDYTIIVDLQEDLLRLEHVYVVDNLFREELDELNQENNE
ncbi:MAG: rod shape-determining protein MreC [Saprospiraceae bacterium]|nr:rod shape-determining protein MreC [Saprospiraceae bacterium]MCB9325138.1 rod shape-determining protein MreC [Lewinellaceae bacterium]